MLLFITDERIFFEINSHISIHLMLLFISMFAFSHEKQSNFNTSHVTVYHWQIYLLFSVNKISIHLMLLFIALHPTLTLKSSSFQYISCYCLSGKSFNIFSIHCSFQYISCYCLSAELLGKRYALFTFQYISCYCLSAWRK